MQFWEQSSGDIRPLVLDAGSVSTYFTIFPFINGYFRREWEGCQYFWIDIIQFN